MKVRWVRPSESGLFSLTNALPWSVIESWILAMREPAVVVAVIATTWTGRGGSNAVFLLFRKVILLVLLNEACDLFFRSASHLCTGAWRLIDGDAFSISSMLTSLRVRRTGETLWDEDQTRGSILWTMFGLKSGGFGEGRGLRRPARAAKVHRTNQKLVPFDERM